MHSVLVLLYVLCVAARRSHRGLRLNKLFGYLQERFPL